MAKKSKAKVKLKFKGRLNDKEVKKMSGKDTSISMNFKASNSLLNELLTFPRLL